LLAFTLLQHREKLTSLASSLWILSFLFILLLFAELIPRQIARIYPKQLSLTFAPIYSALLSLTWPVLLALTHSKSLCIKRVKLKQIRTQPIQLSGNELRHLVEAEGISIPSDRLAMLSSIVDLESTYVEDIMIPRHQLVGIDLAADWADIEKQVIHSLFTRLLIYEQSVDNILGFVHIRRLLPLLAENKLDRERLRATIRPAYFIPEGTTLIQQLLNFREHARRSAIVVDEYGDILGMLALEDILEEIVGEFSTAPVRHEHTIQIMPDGSAWLDGSAPIREVNQSLKLNLPVDGPKTINGLIMEHLESLPVPGMTVLIDQHPMEIRKTRKNAIKTLIIYPAIQQRAFSGVEHGKN
jgi:Mg2+/Co2+ transporter CorB